MPRLTVSALRSAYSYSRYLPLLLSATRDLGLARNELRWLKEYVDKAKRLKEINPTRYQYISAPTLSQLCHQRASGYPLQYILGSQPFCDLEILCKKGILIPRPETEVYTTRLGNLLLQNVGTAPEPLSVLDLCAGTGCIGLGLFSMLQHRFPDLQVRAIDINPKGKSIARKSMELNSKLDRIPYLNTKQYDYRLADILDVEQTNAIALSDERFNIIVSNPPYISIPAFSRDTSRSARYFEPKNALVPPIQTIDKVSAHNEDTGDLFYHHILRIADRQRAEIVIMEVADVEQAQRVMKIAERTENGGNAALWSVKQIWCDEIGMDGSQRRKETKELQIIGTGHGRAVILARSWGTEFMNRSV